jgi:CDP-diacylglycerol--glycerol-3-phosphate 3-phosphatidyltransferase
MGTTQAASDRIMTLPNQITVARLIVSLFLFVCLSIQWYGAALVLFVLAASTDWIDGYLARRYQLVSQLGRILDPFADKLLVLGTFVFLAAASPDSGVPAWMAVVVLARELLVTALRSFLEQQGHDFSASFSGKLKMVFQCALAVVSLLRLSMGDAAPIWLPTAVYVLAWITVISTIQSGWGYVVAAARLWNTSLA